MITYGDATDSVLNCIYSIFIALWTTIFVESWKRKQNWLANRWLVRDFKEVSFDRKEFRASWNVDVELRHAWKKVKPNYYGLTVALPVSVSFMAIVIGSYIGIQYWHF